MKTLGWGLFCACSWTWCIGMFLPVILLGRWGWAGFIAFAVPNVIGCAAFGYVLRDPARMSRTFSDHRGAMRLFSVVTLAYHVFFIGFIAWVLAPVEPPHALRLAIVAPVALLAISELLSHAPDRAWLPAAAIVYGVSLGVFAAIGAQPLSEIPLARGEMLAGFGGLIWLVPALAFGFLLCPYLDMTFHRALRSSPSRHAFAVFGVAFFVMIVLTAAYWDVLHGGLAWIVLAHITAQSIFTMAAHQRELRESAERAGDGQGRASTGAGTPRLAAAGALRLAAARLQGTLLPLLAMPLAFAGAFHVDALAASIDMYLRVLVFYGLVFPAYVLLFISPWRVMRPRRPDVVRFVLLVLVAAALCESAFIHERTVLAALPPIALLIWAALQRVRAVRPGPA